MDTIEQQRATFGALLVAVSEAYRQLKKAPLPDFFKDPFCCDSQELRVVTDGWCQWVSVELGYDPDDETEAPRPTEITAYSDGWDDMTEDGEITYLACVNCQAVWEQPERLEWGG